jgi:hypothetical protein
MSVDRTLHAYQNERLNCAQSVLRGFQPQLNISEEDITNAKACGGGRAEGGLCGALHAALQLVDDPAQRLAMKDAFVEKAGAATCREIKTTVRTPCVDCVRIAATLLSEQKA